MQGLHLQEGKMTPARLQRVFGTIQVKVIWCELEKLDYRTVTGFLKDLAKSLVTEQKFLVVAIRHADHPEAGTFGEDVKTFRSEKWWMDRLTRFFDLMPEHTKNLCNGTNWHGVYALKPKGLVTVEF